MTRPADDLPGAAPTLRNNDQLCEAIYHLRRWLNEWALDNNVKITIECATDEQKYATMDCIKRGFRFDSGSIVPARHEGFAEVVGIPLKITSTKERTKW